MESKDKLALLEEKLYGMEDDFKEIITSALELIQQNPSFEKEVLQAFINPATRITEYFKKESKRTNNETVEKCIVKYVMFKRL